MDVLGLVELFREDSDERRACVLGFAGGGFSVGLVEHAGGPDDGFRGDDIPPGAAFRKPPEHREQRDLTRISEAGAHDEASGGTGGGTWSGDTRVGRAGRDPKGGEELTLDCGPDGTATVITFSNGRWSPGLDADGTAVFVPTAFGELSGTFLPNDGGDPISFSDPPMIKTSPANKAPKLSCTFAMTFTDENGTGSFSGSVIGFKTPAHG
jgi:hypothetical protein